MLTKGKAAPLAAEFLGTTVLVMMALVISQTTSVSYFVGTSLALALAVIYMLFGSVSGGHFNPAVSFGLWTARKISSLKCITYIVAQLLGGLAAWQLLQYLTGHQIAAKATHWNTTMWIAEVVGTAVLATGYAAVVYKKLDSLQSALTLGAAIFVGVVLASTSSAGYINPAIALGERSFDAVYILGPLVGGLIAVNLYSWLFAGTKLNVTTFKKK